MSTVFISYSHKDETWKNSLLPQLKTIEQAGVDLHVWEDRRIDAGDKWYPEITEAMKTSTAAILLISADYLASPFCIKEEVSYLLKRQEEEGMLLIPVLIRQCFWKAHRWLADRQMLPRDGKCVAIDFPGDNADTVFCEVAEKVFEHVNKAPAHAPTAATRGLPSIPRVTVRSFSTLESVVIEPKYPVLPEDAIDLSRLPESGKELFGRDKELSLLDGAWEPGNKPSALPTRARVLALIAQGGIGKSSLVNHWLHDMAEENYRGARKVFGWSFYSQGTHSEGMASADSFIAAALSFFGGEEGKKLADSPASAWEKGKRLAKYIGAERSLLILDGMEPLQSPHRFERGKIRDPAMETLLRYLAREPAGLCIVTSREPLFDLAELPGIVTCDIEQITPEAGRALLRAAHVVGTDKELENLAERFGPHALSVSLLGVYLYETDPGHGISGAESLEQLPGVTPLDRMLAGFEKWLGSSGEVEVLHLLGLFDRPIDSGCLNALKAEPAIKGLTERIVRLKEVDWERLLLQLEKLQLIHVRLKGTDRQAIDAHPLLREYFAKKLNKENPEGWREGHRRLYEYLTTSTIDKEEPTLEELQPLYQAVVHGCKAGLVEEAFEKVYLERISKGKTAYVVKKLGASGADLGSVACFFEKPWKDISPALSEDTHAWLLHEAAFRLRAIGRLNEAIEPLRTALERDARVNSWKEAATSAINLIELELSLGDIESAVQNGCQSVTFADRSGDAFLKMVIRTNIADSLHQAGKADEAFALFHEAETMQAEMQPGYPLLYSLQGFRFCNQLLAMAERSAWQRWKSHKNKSTAEVLNNYKNEIVVFLEVKERVQQTLYWAQKGNLGLLSIALDHLTLGRIGLYYSFFDPTNPGHHRSTIDNSTAAINGLRAVGAQEFIESGLLTRAWVRLSLENDPARSRADLDEAQRIAERSGMLLHLADVHLHRGRLFSDKSEIAKARALIEKCGYWRRKGELEDAEEWVK